MFKIKKNRRVLSIDIGSSSVKLIEIENKDDKLVVEKYISQQYSVSNRKLSLEEKVFNALSIVFASYSFKARECVISIPMDEAYIRFVKLPPINLNNDKIRKIVEYEALQYIPYDVNNVVLDYQLIGNPSVRLDVMFVVTRDDFVQNLVETFSGFGYKLDYIDISTCASYNIAKANFVGKTDCAIYISIGARETSCVFISSDSFFVRKSNWGGDDLTKVIALKCHISFAKAEVLKKKFCSTTDGGGVKNENTIAILRKEISAFLENIINEIGRSINQYRSERDGSKPQKIYLGGGSSVMPNIIEKIEEKIRIPVEYLNAFQCFDLDDSINRDDLAKEAHFLSEVLGNALRYFYNCPITISLRSKKLLLAKKINSKMGYFVMLYFVILVYPLIGYFDAQSAVTYQRGKIKENEKIIKRDKSIFHTIKNNNNAVNTIENNLDDLGMLMKQRTSWLSLIKVIEENTPQGIWLTSLKVADKQSVSAILENKENYNDKLFLKNIEWQRKNKLPLRPNQIDKISIIGYSIYDVSIEDVEQSLPERFLQKLKEYNLQFIMQDRASSKVKNEVILDEAQNITSFELIITVFNALPGE